MKLKNSILNSQIDYILGVMCFIMSFKRLSVLMVLGGALCVFSPSDMEFLDRQRANDQTRIQQMKIDCDQRVRDAQDAAGRDRDAATQSYQTANGQWVQCSADLQKRQADQSSFLGRFGQLLDSNPAIAKLLGPVARDAQGNIVDLNAAYDVIVIVLRAATASEQVDALRRDVDTCRKDAVRFQTAIKDAQTRMQEAEGRATDCLNRATQNDAACRQNAGQVDMVRRDLQTCQAEAQNLRRTADDATNRVRQIEINLNTCTQQAGNNGQDVTSLRGKMQFLYDISGYCRQNFYNLGNDKAALASAFADLTTFVTQMSPISSIPGGLEEKITTLGNERSSFRRRVELISVILNSLFTKVDDYTRILRTDGYDNLTTGNGQGTYGSWVFNPSTDGVDVNNLTTLEACRGAVNTLREKVSAVTTNLNTAVRNNNECLKKFNEASAVMMIGAGLREDY